MKKIFTILLFNLLYAGVIFAQPVSLGSLQGNETYFTGFDGKVYFASGSEILVADPDMGNIASLLTLSQPVVTDNGYSVQFIRNRDIFYAPRFPVAGEYIYFLTKASSDSITLWRNHKDGNTAEEIGVFDTVYAYVEFDGALFFAANKKDYNFQIWKVADNGEVFPISDRPAGNNTYYYTQNRMGVGEGFLYFSYENPLTGKFELFESDGSAEGTELIHTADYPMSYPTELLENLFFASAGRLWKYDQTSVDVVVEPSLGMYGPVFVTKVNNYLIYGEMHEMDTYTLFYSIENGTGPVVPLNMDANYFTYTHTDGKLIVVENTDHMFPYSFERTDGTPGGTAGFMSYGDMYVAHHMIAVSGYLFYGLEPSGYSDLYPKFHLMQSDLNGPGEKVSDIFGGVEEYLMVNNFASSEDILFFTTADTVIGPNSAPKELFYYHPSDIITAVTRSQTIEWSVYPNPASDHCVIKADASGTLQLMNAAGRVVLEVAFDRMNVLDMSGLQSGIYFARLITGDKVSPVQKIVRK